MDNSKFEILKLVTDIVEKESDRGWVRFSTMLYINSALIGFVSVTLSAANKYIYIVIPSAIIGIILSIVWFFTISWSLFYQDRWIEDQKRIIESDPDLQKWMTGRNKELRAYPLIYKIFNPRQGLWHVIPFSFFIIWLILIISI